MRTDVKLGIVTSMVVVLAAGGYFLFRGDTQTPIPIADKALPRAPKSAAKQPTGKQLTTNATRQGNSSKDANRTMLPVHRDPKVATQPTKRATFVERPVDSMPATPESSPAGALPSDVPKTVTSRESDAGYTSRTLMAGNEPIKNVPSTPADAPALSSPAPGTPVAASKPQPSGTPLESKLDLGKAAVDTHRVQPGDSLASLAQTYYGNSKYSTFLAESNPGISDPAKLTLGASVKIPPLPQDIDTRMSNATSTKATPAATGNTASKRTYKVKSGDSFYKIAKEQLGNAERWKELLELNKTLVHGDPTQLQPGQTLVLPD